MRICSILGIAFNAFDLLFAVLYVSPSRILRYVVVKAYLKRHNVDKENKDTSYNGQ